MNERRTIFLERFNLRGVGGAGSHFAAATGAGGTAPAGRWAMILFAALIAAPIVLLVLFAGVVALAAFMILSLAQRMRMSARGLLARFTGGALGGPRRTDGRENVRVIHRAE